MTTERPGRHTLRGWVPAALLSAAFLAPGAWLVVGLPPVPVAKALDLFTAGAWMLAFGLGAASFARPGRGVLAALGVVLAVIAASYLANGWLFPVAFYDLFADMPLVQWLAFPAVFALAAGWVLKSGEARRAAACIVVAGSALAVVMAWEFVTARTVAVFGSTGYVPAALSPIVPLAVGLAVGGTRRAAAAWYACAAVTVVSLSAFSGSTMGALAAVFAVVVSVAVFVRGRSPRPSRGSVPIVLPLAVAGLMIAGLLVAQVPALSGGILSPQAAARFDKNVVTRVYLWQGAQRMLAERPLLGWGPSGYRVNAARFLSPEALQFGPDSAGNVDPTVYSPQSPHSLFWELATRLGVLGLLSFAGLLACWALALRGRMRDPAGPGLRPAFAAGFACALFALLVNPVLFPIGLLSPALAGLAIAPAPGSRKRPENAPRAVPAPVRWTVAALGTCTVLVALWLGLGEWKAYTVDGADPATRISQLEAVLAVIPSHPPTQRKLLEQRLFAAADVTQVADAQRAVDGAPGYIPAFAPDIPSLVAYSLAQADRTGRTDVGWETAQLSRAAAVLPEIPSLVAERLHVAVIARDAAAIRAALPAARRWGSVYPYTADYIRRADEILASGG